MRDQKAAPDPDGDSGPALYADDQHDDSLELGGLRTLAMPCLTAIESLEALWAHPERHKCESPIEEIFLGRLIRRWPAIDVKAQVPIGRYRVDFLINGRLVVECDGREFHSLPWHQVRDRERDAFLRDRGLVVIRLTGAQINSAASLWAIETLL